MISVTILTKNSSATVKKTLESLCSFPEVCLYDTGSTDETLLIAKAFSNVVIHQGEFIGFGPTHNVASSLAKSDWILSIDSDEVLSSELIQEIHALKLDPAYVYEILRHNFFNGKRIKGCAGWHPDSVVRLYHRKSTHFSNDAVHEKILPLKVCRLSSPLYHTPYRSIDDFLDKMQKYTTLYASQNPGKKSSFSKALLHGWYAFFKSYIMKRGFLNGKEGYIISAYNGHTAFYKHLKKSTR